MPDTEVTADAAEFLGAETVSDKPKVTRRAKPNARAKRTAAPAPAPVREIAPAAMQVAATGMPKRVKIWLEENDDIPPTGLPLGHNGTSYIICPGEEVEVPAFLVEILDNAVMAMPVKDPQTQRVIGYRDRLRYPYRKL